MQAQPAAGGQEPQEPPAPAISSTSGDSRAMLTHANRDAADSPSAAAQAAGDQGLQMVAPNPAMVVPAASDPGTVPASPCGAMHTPAMTALLCGEPTKGVPDAIDVMGIRQHKLGADPSRWRDVQPAGGPVEAQVGLPTYVGL